MFIVDGVSVVEVLIKCLSSIDRVSIEGIDCDTFDHECIYMYIVNMINQV